MKELLFVLALVVASVPTIAADTQKNVRIFHECMRELGIKSFHSKDFHDKFVCINVCEYEKAGMVTNGKYLEDKYMVHYMRNFPNAGPIQVSVLTDCIKEANKESDKCNVGRSLQNCEIKNHNLLFGEASDAETNNEIEEDN